MDQNADPRVIALDAMGGDFGPKPLIEGALWAVEENPKLRVLLVGVADKIESTLNTLRKDWKHLALEIVPAVTVNEMEESKFALARKRLLQKESSIQKCVDLVRENKAHGAVSAGSTTASIYWCLELLKTYPTDDLRPALPISWPHSKGFTILLDGGAGVDADAETLTHFAVLGYLYARFAYAKVQPSVGLLSIGEERTKGSPRIREAYQLISDRLKENFIGMVEGKDLARGKADVVVCDGFVGNIALKLGEGVVEEFGQILKDNLNVLGKLGAFLMLPALKKVKRRLSWETYGAVPLLGVDGAVFIAHGKSTPLAIHNALRNAYSFAQKNALKEIKAHYRGSNGL